MKIQISYLPGEALAARTVEEFVRVILPGVRVRKIDRKPPFLHLYMTTKKPGKPRNFNGND